MASKEEEEVETVTSPSNLASIEEKEDGDVALPSNGQVEGRDLVPSDISAVGIHSQRSQATSTATGAVVPAAQPAPPVINMGIQSNVTNLDNREYNVNQQIAPLQNSNVGTLVGGQHNLVLNAGEGSNVSVYQGRPQCDQHTPCYQPNPPKVEEPDSSDEEDDDIPQGEAAIPPVDYNELIWDVFIEPMEENERLFRKFKFFCRQVWATQHGLSSKKIKKMEPERLLKHIEKCQLSSPHNLEFLLEMMKRLKQDESVMKIENFKLRHKDDILTIYKPNGTVANGKFHTEVVKHGDIRTVQVSDVDRLNQVFNEQLGLPKSAVNFTGSGSGSIVLVFLLPIRWSIVDKDGNRRVINVKEMMQEAVRSRAKWLQDEGIIGVHVEGQDYVRIDDCTQELDMVDVSVRGEPSLLSDISDSEDDIEHPEESVTLESKTASNTQQEEVKKFSVPSGHFGEGLKYVKKLRAKPIQTPAVRGPRGATASYADYQPANDPASEQEMFEIRSKYHSIERRINLLASNQVRYIPSMMKTYIRDFQREIQKTAETVAKMAETEGSTDLYDLAIRIYSRGVEVAEFAQNIGFSLNIAINRNIMLARVECMLKLADALDDVEIRQLFYQRSWEDSELVHKMDSSDTRSTIYKIAALFRLQKFGFFSPFSPDMIFNTFHLLELFKNLPEEHHTHPMISEFLELYKRGTEFAEHFSQVPEHKQEEAVQMTEKAKAEKRHKTKSKKKKRTKKLRSRVDHGGETHREKRKHSRQPKGTESESGMGSELVTQTSSDSDTDDLGCSYCKLSFDTFEEKNHHITTPEHKTNLNSDQDRPWKHRSPPLNVTNGNYHFCDRFLKGKCPFSKLQSVNNSCPMAHSDEELLEWEERHKYRRMKMMKASQNMFSFLDDLRYEYYIAEKQLEVMTERIPDGVTIAFQPPGLKASVESLDTDANVVYKFEWEIVIKTSTTKKQLMRIGLLNDIYRLHFYLTHPINTHKPQICQADQVPSQETEDGQKQYTIGALFSSRMLGKYEQWIVFDFGEKPMVFQKLGVRVGSSLDSDDNLKSDNIKQTWDASNCNIVKFNKFQSGFEKRLELRYRTMDLPKEAGILNSDNYKQFMHYMLKAEERERTEKLKRYGMKVQMTPKQMFHVKSPSKTMTFGAENLKKGQRFGKVDLTHALNDDTSASQIALTSVQYIYIKFDESDNVYEAEIFHDREMEETSIKDELYVVLSDICVRDVNLTKSETKKVEIQFQLDRRHFLRMHNAVDQITTMEYLFPPENPNPALICPQEHGEVPSSTCELSLNKWQEAAARFIASRGGSRDPTPLLLLYGPFGTGKTLTLAKGVMNTLLKAARPRHGMDCPRILICTHSNSAADLYITRYFHNFVQTCMDGAKYRVQIRRVYATTRDIRSIPKKVRPYINVERGRLKIDSEDIRRCHVVITTTSTAARLHSLPKGHFTHILLDEAGQILETEAIIPLALASQHTCVVIAGDHVQMGPVVYSPEAKAQNFDHSLLERLFEYSSSNNCHRHIILSDNYRSCKEILKFLSKMFYHAKHLQALGDHHTVASLYPMEFRAVMGDDECLGNSYVNNFEADEISKRLKKLQEDWPAEWGKFNQSDIGVLTPYTLQVRRIRKLLDKSGFGDVIVERVQNVQGKEYRVVFISTVRTRHTIADDISDDPDHYLGFLSDTRQLNTAFTRAKSLVVVVGNPVALCSVGKCCKVWKSYIEECHKNESLYGVKDESEVEYAIQSVTSSSRQPDFKATQKFEDSGFESYQYSTAEDEHSAIEEIRTGYEQRFSLVKSKEIWKGKSHEPEASTTSESTSEDDEIDLLQELKRESRRRRYDTLTASDVSESGSEADPADYYIVDEDDGETWVQRRILQTQEGAEGSKTPTGEVKTCKFRVDYDGKKYAVPIDDPVGSEEILISTNTQRKTALDGDEVEVEIIEDSTLIDTDVEQQDDNEEHPKYGRVLRVSSRAEEMRDKEIVCFPDLYADNLMVPVDQTMPKIFILRQKEDRQKRRGQKMLTIPICRFRNKRVQCIRNVDVPSKDRVNTLFVVRWVSWEDRFYYPLGMVTEELPKNVDEETGLDTLRRIFYVPEEWEDEDVDEQRRLTDLSKNYSNREDLRAEHVITIDPESTQDLDDALSVRRLPDGSFEIHIHIADVTHLVEKGDDIDKEARERVTSFYPSNNDPIHMLPPLLSTNLCSFVQGKDRVAFSVFAKIDINGNLIEQPRPEIRQTVIRNRRRLTYCETECIIGAGVEVDDITRDVILLHHVATIIRGQRLKGRRYALNLEGDSAKTPQAHILVEEMMILANRIVGNFLMEKYPNTVPIRRQLPPEMKKLKYWHDAHGREIVSSVYLSEEDAYLRSLGDEDFADVHEIRDADTIDIQKTVWSKIQSMNLDDPNDKRTIATIITSDQHHPQTVPALSGLHHVMRKADYVCSGAFKNDKLAHTSLHTKFYTHFTSPIRRYIDIVVHRILKAALTEERPVYKQSELSEVCHQCSVKGAKAKDFEIKTRALQLALHVRRIPVSVLSVVESVSDSNMMVGFSSYPMISEANRRSDIKFNLLKPIGKPDVDDDKKKAGIKWKERIFNVQLVKQMTQNDIRGNRQKHIQLDTKRFVVKMPASRWKEMQECVNRGDKCSLRHLIQEEAAKQINSLTEDSAKPFRDDTRAIVTEVTCELGSRGSDQKSHHYVEFKRDFSPGDVVQVQLQAGLHRGLMSPKVALVHVTPLLNFCAEHRSEVVECFAEIVDRRPDREDIKSYQRTLLPIIEMMTVYNAVYGNDTIIIHGIQIEWQQRSEDSLPCGSFNLSTKFCNERHIKIFSPRGTGLKFDYLCIRYSKPKEVVSFTSGSQTMQQYDSDSISEYQQPTFVAHGHVVDTNADDDDEGGKGNPRKQQDYLTVFFEVHHCSSPFPIQLLTSSGDDAHRCTIEVIPKAVPDRRIEKAVQLLDHVDKDPELELIQNICLLKSITDDDEPADWNLNYLEIKASPFPPLNYSQKIALHKALTQPFTVIQGPPGTGKTMTGACLVHFFTEDNKTLRSTGRRPQVLYCGPSNKSVDVIAGYLKRFQHSHKLSILRVYSESIEYKDFPPPFEPGPRRKLEAEDVKMDPELKDISLHYRIRGKQNIYAEVIRTFERQFDRNSTKVPSEEDIMEYSKNIERAEREELGKHQVILCTCNTAGQKRIKKFTNIIQCIVDEAGMCNEPETIVPLVSTKPRKIVLVGDHKQLRPIIQENTAQQLGMDISLLEQYSKKVAMLDTQYRMHKAICEFPSKAFYEGRLKTADVVIQRQQGYRRYWPGGGHQPTVFCHIIGKEETLSVHTEEGNEMSKANHQEVTQVVRIALTLVKHHGVPAKNVVILTQYQLQRKHIENRLKDKGKKAEDIDVRTVIKSQGSEWDYVIISTVRSLPRVEIEDNSTYGWRKHHLGFITDDNQMNVALTRARKGLIIVGNMYLLQTDKTWKKLIDHYWQKNCVMLQAGAFLPGKW